MAIAVTASASGNGSVTTNTTAVSVSGTGANCLLVFLTFRTNNDATGATVTYAGASMTQVYSVSGQPFGCIQACYRLVSPASGSNNVVATLTGASGATNYTLVAVMLSGVDTTAPVSASATAEDDGTTFTSVTVNVASESGGLVIGCGSFRGGTAVTETIGAGQTLITRNAGTGGGSDDILLATSTEAGAATVTTSWTYTPGATYNAAVGAVALNAAGASAPTINTQPSNATVTAPATANFTVSATASGGSLTYQWERSDNSGGSWASVSTGTGGTSASYTTAATSAVAAGSGGDNNAQFRCVVTDSNGSTTTSAATLTVNPGAEVFGIRNYGARGMSRYLLNY